MSARPHLPSTRAARRLAAAVVGAACFVAALPTGCRPLPPPAVRDGRMKTDPGQVPRDPEAAERRRVAIQSWVEDSLLGSYAASGHRSPTWDAHVEIALRLAARQWTSDPTAPGDVYDRIWAETSAAQAAGCADPLVAYVRYRFSWGAAPRHELNDAVTRLDASGYPAHWKGWAALALEQEFRPCCLMAEPDPGKEIRTTHVARARAHLPAIVADRTMPTRRVVQYANRLLQAYMWLDKEYEAHYEEVRATIVAARGQQDPSLPLLEAWFHVRLANAARGTKWASETSPEQFAEHAREMQVADELAARAFANGTDPVDLALIASAVAWGRGDRAALEEWFTIGTLLEPGDYTWYDDKVNWLQARWHGSDDELLDFGRQMLAKGRFEARVSMVLLDAHHRVQTGPPKKAGYHARPDVCSDYRAVYDGLLARYPEAWGDRNRYLQRLVECQDWEGASRQLAALGPSHVRSGVLRGQAAYDATSTLIQQRGAPPAAAVVSR
jgi:hypothetical protein